MLTRIIKFFQQLIKKKGVCVHLIIAVYVFFVDYLKCLLELLPISQLHGSQPEDLSDFPKWQLPKCAINQAASSQVYPNRSARSQACSSRSSQPPCLFEPQRSAPPPPMADCGAFEGIT